MVSGTNNKWGSASRANVTHARDKLGRITHLSRWGTMYNVYETGGLDQSFQYSSRGELTHTQTDLMGDYGTLPGRTIHLRYDGQGNRKQLKIDGLPSHTYTPGPANEYTQVNYGAHAGGISGTSSQPGNVLVGNDLAERQYGYFYRGFLPSTNAKWTFEDIFAAKPPPSGGYVTAYRAAQKELYLPPASVTPVYDAAGNLKEDGWWEYEYDGENRLIKMTSAAFLSNSTNKRELLFKYDYLGRRVQKTVNKRTIGGGTILVSDTAYAYWDWHLIAEVGYLEDSPSILRHYAWGLDKEGVRPGAGGVGGLLMISDHGASKKTYLALNDYIGNVIGLLDPDTGSTVAEYVPSEATSCRRSPTAYDPFGRQIRATGTYADKNPIRFSSQYTDNETGLVYFGFRYYHPQWGRFINRDPVEEAGGENLYRFVSNDPVNRWDHLGQAWFAGAVAGFVLDLTVQVATNVATGKDWHDVSIASAGVSAAQSAIGVGSLSLARKAVTAVKAAKTAKRTKTLATVSKSKEIQLKHVGTAGQEALAGEAKKEVVEAVAIAGTVVATKQAAKAVEAKIVDSADEGDGGTEEVPRPDEGEGSTEEVPVDQDSESQQDGNTGGQDSAEPSSSSRVPHMDFYN